MIIFNKLIEMKMLGQLSAEREVGTGICFFRSFAVVLLLECADRQ
jgi:hypothetical protein